MQFKNSSNKQFAIVGWLFEKNKKIYNLVMKNTYLKKK